MFGADQSMFVEFEQLLTPMNDRFEGASNHNSDGGRSVDSKKSTNSSKYIRSLFNTLFTVLFFI